MTNKELFDLLKEKDDCWEEWREKIDGGKWEGFGWLWERCIEQDWWEDFFGEIDIPNLAVTMSPRIAVPILLKYLINPTRFVDALKEHLGGER